MAYSYSAIKAFKNCQRQYYGVIVHDDIPHGDMTFDEESRPQ